MGSSFRKEYTIRKVGLASFNKGVRTPGVPEIESTITASVQPAIGKEVEAMPETIRASVAYKMYTDTPLNSHDMPQPHQVQVGSEWYLLHAVGDYDSNVINHNKYMLLRMKEGQVNG